tara:strand:+ start:4955 stop:5692 length:738 start_codon:yes stop_codon:yes gene_type:complete
MGGTSYIICGELEPTRIESGPRQKTLVQKLLSCLGVRQHKHVSDFDSSFITLPPGGLVQIAPAFRRFLAHEFRSPWPATKTFLDYLKMGFPVIYLRGEKEHEKTDTTWYVQVAFSGCAGVAQTSSKLAFHWLEIWLKNNIQQLNETILKPEGFTANLELKQMTEDPLTTFVPVGTEKYGIYACVTFAEGKLPEFNIDESAYEFRDDDGEELFAEIRNQLGELMSDGQCRCQMCMPDYQPMNSISL